MLSTESFIDIKQQLQAEGVIECNGTTSMNYTVKKVFINVYGECHRDRFIKIKRCFLMAQEGLTLEEMKGMSKCTSEKLELNQS